MMNIAAVSQELAAHDHLSPKQAERKTIRTYGNLLRDTAKTVRLFGIAAGSVCFATAAITGNPAFGVAGATSDLSTLGYSAFTKRDFHKQITGHHLNAEARGSLFAGPTRHRLGLDEPKPSLG